MTAVCITTEYHVPTNSRRLEITNPRLRSTHRRSTYRTKYMTITLPDVHLKFTENASDQYSIPHNKHFVRFSYSLPVIQRTSAYVAESSSI